MNAHSFMRASPFQRRSGQAAGCHFVFTDQLIQSNELIIECLVVSMGKRLS